MRVAVIGQGHVGLVASIGFVEAGHNVVGVESNETLLEELDQGAPHFFEPGLNDALSTCLDSGRLRFTSSLEAVGGEMEAVVIAVGSPPLPSGGADLRDIYAVIRDVTRLEHLPELVLLKSTVPPGTSDRLLSICAATPEFPSRYIYSPEFLSQGSALPDWRQPARVVVGTHNPELIPAVQQLHGLPSTVPWLVTTPVTAEMVKYASNAFLATKVSFINQIAGLCEDVGADIDDVVAGMAHDPRIGPSYLRPGVGYGGSCFPKDNRALAHLSGLHGRPLPLLEAVVAVNSLQRIRILRTVTAALSDFDGATVAVAGVSFKPGTDDVREAPSTWIIPDLLSAGLNVRVWDPAVAPAMVRSLFPGASQCTSVLEAVSGAQALVILTEWPDVVQADWSQAACLMQAPGLIVDGRNCLDPVAVRTAGLRYSGVGRVSP